MNTAFDIATYAFRGDGKYMLLIGAVLSLFASFTGVGLVIGGIASLVFVGFFAAYYFEIIQATAMGRDEAPDFPTISSLMDDVVMPLARLVLVWLVAYAPFLVFTLFFSETRLPSWLPVFFLIAGSVYFPMAVLAVVILGGLFAVSPHIVLPGLFHGGWLYWVGLVTLGLLDWGLILVGALPVAPLALAPVSAFVGTYVCITNARILGLVYRQRQQQFGWL